MTVPDEKWAAVAIASREALALLGYEIGPRCLPGEPDHCGGGWADHAGAQLATLIAIARHELVHLGQSPAVTAAIIGTVTEDITSRCGVINGRREP